MAVYVEDMDRKVIPRWRTFLVTLCMNELTPLESTQKPHVFDVTELLKKKTEWEDHRTFSYAADLVGCGVALGQSSELREAAEFLLNKSRSHEEAVRTIARRALDIDDIAIGHPILSQSVDRPQLENEVRIGKTLISTQPRNVFPWVDLARAYETLGIPLKATKAMETALALAPNNRFVIRSAATLYVHQNKYERAHDILRKRAITREDPWLLAAEIAVASTAGRISRNVRRSRQMVSSRKFSFAHLSELSSALATLELEAGSTSKARRYFKDSLQNPTENAVAQACWASRNRLTIDECEQIITTGPNSHEALAWDYCQQSKWQSSLEESRNWLFDQPFSSRPAILSSYLTAVVMADYHSSASLAQFGLMANPQDFALLNNYAFALAQCTEVAKAQQIFSKIDEHELSDSDRIVWLATSALLHYGLGQPREGRKLYLDSIELAKKIGDHKRRSQAFLFFALEELRARTKDAESFRKRGLELTKDLHFSDLLPLISRVQDYKIT